MRNVYSEIDQHDNLYRVALFLGEYGDNTIC